jgi:methylmalonyl-CoA/ethylmalonyl-CoA epimerase
MKIDHVGIAVASLEEAASFYLRTMGLEVEHREEVPEQKVRVAFLRAGETSIELLEPTGPDGAIARFIAKRGPGLHHLAFAVSDIKGEMTELSKKSAAPIESEARPGARGSRVCFVHPRKTGGVLIELVERGI